MCETDETTRLKGRVQELEIEIQNSQEAWDALCAQEARLKVENMRLREALSLLRVNSSLSSHQLEIINGALSG